HAVALGVLALVALLLGRLLLRFPARLTPRRTHMGIALVLLVAADAAWAGYATRHDTGQYSPSQWGFAAYANPARVPLLDGFWRSIFFEQPDLEKANAQAKRGEQS